MKKILSVLVALLLIISIPASAATKTPKKAKPQKKVYTEKKVDIKLDAAIKNVNGTPVWDLTASVPKKGSSIKYEWTVLLDGKDTGIKLSDNNTKYSYKSGKYTITAKFTPADASKKYEISFKATMSAGKSHVVFVGKKTIALNNAAPPQPKVSTYDFKAEGIPSVILPNQPITFPLTLKVSKDSSTSPEFVKINVGVSDSTKMTLTANNANLITSQQLGDPFVIDKNYDKKTDITAMFTQAGVYSVTFTLANVFPYKELATKTVNFIVYPNQASAIQKLDIIKLKLVPSDAAKGLYNLSVDKLLVTYNNGTTLTITDYKYPVATININLLTDPNYTLQFNVVYNNTVYPFTMTSNQIVTLLLKE